MASFPKTLADLKAGDDSFFASQNFYGSLKELRRSTLSIPNRLRSIVKDADFVQQVAERYKLPVVANERCGSWYVQPKIKAGSAYFKSTDGHTGQWKFSLRRLNLHVLYIVGQHGGCIIVDSTRRGKVMPDSFSKTVPIWCVVMNRAIFPEQTQFHRFQLPGVGLPASEIAQIESRLDGFVGAFHDLGFDREALRQRLVRPIRLQWVIGHSMNALSADEVNFENADALYHNIILCSASRRVIGAEMSEGGYIQGAGDDSEGWSQGMTPQMFWRDKETLFQVQEEELAELIKKLLSKEGQLRIPQCATVIEPTKNLYIAGLTGQEHLAGFDLIIHCHSHSHDPGMMDGPKQVNLRCESGKLGSRDLRYKLQEVDSCAASIIEQNPACCILITCKSGKDLSVGVALMLLCRFYSHDGRCVYNSDKMFSTVSGITSNPIGLQDGPKVDKSFIIRRLAWITSSKPDANPSRSTLQSVNAYLMNRH